MTLQKAIKILDILIEQETILAKGMINTQNSWNQDFQCLRDLAKSLADNIQNEIMALELIKKASNSRKYFTLNPFEYPYLYFVEQ